MQTQRSPELHAQFAAGLAEGRRGLAAVLAGVPEDNVPEETVRSVGAVQMALMSGLVVQWLTDSATAPTAAEVMAGIRVLGSD